MKKNVLRAAVVTALATAAGPQLAAADILVFDWDGVFTMLDANGAAMANSSIPAKGNNQYQTAVSGTLSFDTVTGAGSGTMVPFDFFSNDPALPVEAVGINLQAIGDGMGGPGTLVLGNMLFNWNGNYGIPVSIVMDAAGLFGAMQGGLRPGDVISGVGAIPASDGTYVGGTVPGTVTGPGGFAGYLGLGPNPIVTTAWNTTSLCTRGGVGHDGACMGLSPSGGFPLLEDTVPNVNDDIANDGGTIGGSPMIDGPFPGGNANFDITSLTRASVLPGVPVPAAVWLFGSGLLGLMGVARRKKA